MIRQITVWSVCVLISAGVCASPPTHKQIDKLVRSSASGKVSQLATDGEFLRRVYLDLVGDIPTAEEALHFLEDRSSLKRQRLIDALLNDPRYARNMAERFNIMLMERREPNEHWSSFLNEAFTENRSADVIVKQILTPNTDPEKLTGANHFLTSRLQKIGQNPTDYPGLASDIGRMFLGVNLACAQCHDHLFVTDYKQVDFQGMYAFVLHSFIRNDVPYPAIGERIMDKPLEFSSVFGGDQNSTGPRIYMGKQFEVEVFENGKEYAVEANKATKEPAIPRFSPLRLLSESLPNADNRQFARNFANRLWFLMMGRGIVHPLDLHHSENEASHPQILDILETELIRSGFDVKYVLRIIASTETYQRSSSLPRNTTSVIPSTFRSFPTKPLSAEQLKWSMLRATGMLKSTNIDSPSESDTTTSSNDISPNMPHISVVNQKFLDAYANPAKEPEIDFTPSVRAALFLLNDDLVVSWTLPSAGNLAEQLSDMDTSHLSEHLFLTVLSRRPTEDETRTVEKHLLEEPDKTIAISNMIWALLASTEFATNH